MSTMRHKRIAITRSKADSAEFLTLVERHGGTGVPLDTIRIIPAGREAGSEFARLLADKGHDYCAFLSAQSVAVLSNLLEPSFLASALSGTAVIAIGPKTRDALQEIGVERVITPSKYSSTGIVELMASLKPRNKKIIIPRSLSADGSLAASLSKLGMQVDEVHTYSVAKAQSSEEWHEFAESLANGTIDAIIFTSASNVDAFFEILSTVHAGSLDGRVKVVSIGPQTSAELMRRKIHFAESVENTVRGATELAFRLLE